LTLQRMLVAASCCLVALTVAARADEGTPAKDTAVMQGGETSKVKKPVKPRAATSAVRLPPERSKAIRQTGIASWYGGAQHGKRTANGEIFDKFELTAAHRTLPLESKVRVTNPANGRSVTVRVTDRGPSRKGRIIDLSQSAAEEIGMKRTGIARVNLETLPLETFPAVVEPDP
jgi:rare lipoprotein A